MMATYIFLLKSFSKVNGGKILKYVKHELKPYSLSLLLK